MAEQKNRFKKGADGDEQQEPKRKKVSPKWNNPLTNYKFIKVVGLFSLLVSVFLSIAFFSYFYNWKTDYDIVHQFSWYELLGNNQIKTNNAMANIGALMAYVFVNNWFGVASVGIPFLLFVVGTKMFFGVRLFSLRKAFAYTVLAMFFFSVSLSYFFKDELLILGGGFGYEVNAYLSGIIGKPGVLLVLVFAVLTFAIVELNFNFQLPEFKKAPKPESADDESSNIKVPSFGNRARRLADEVDQEEELNTEPEEKAESPVVFLADAHDETVETLPLTFTVEHVDADPLIASNGPEFTVEEAEDLPELEVRTVEQLETLSELDKDRMNLTEVTSENEEFDIADYDPTLDLSHYKFPELELLDNHGGNKGKVEKAELEANKDRILQTLKNYNIEIAKIHATIGPTVTLYEIVPAAGVRISKIKNLEDDIALSLSALGIRIIAPMPGKGTIGIEVPNQNPEIVPMKTLLGHEKFTQTSMDLPVALGKTISNDVFIADLAKMPHLLMAGATGQGKSVGLNAILVSLLYKKHPSQIKFVLVDPKKVELTLFNKIEKHFLAKLPDTEEAIITDTKKVVHTLNSLCILMDQRYELLKLAMVRNIKEYNAKFINRKLNPKLGHHFMPYVVLVVDEFADLIMTAGKEVELPIARLAQLARAIGIHLIIATQRPSVNIITGTIKANFPARVAFRVTSKIDSRTILDAGGAEQLIGRGDLLFSTGSDLIRLQCPFVDTPEVERICNHIGEQQGYGHAYELPEFVDENTKQEDDDFDIGERDAMFDEAAQIIVMHQQGSASLLQRKLKLGYNRAGRIIDQLEKAGIVGAPEGGKPRKVLVKDVVTLEQYLKNSVDSF